MTAPEQRTFERAIASFQSRRFVDAKRDFDKFLRAQPAHFGALNLVGIVSMQLAQFEDAELYLRRAIAINAGSDATLYNYGIVLTHLGRWRESFDAFSMALAINPNAPETWNSRSVSLNQLARYEDAIADCDKAISLRADYADALYNKGKALSLSGRYDEALAAYDAALRIKSDLAEAWLGRGHVLGKMSRFDEAAAAYQQALKAAPAAKLGLGYLLFSKANACDWTGLADGWSALLDDIRRGELASMPFALLATDASAADQLSYAKAYALDSFPNAATVASRPARPSSDRIRVAYLSADFRAHAVAYLIAGVFDHHDRTRFETVALSYGPDDGSAMRGRLAGAFDRFVDIRRTSDRDAAALLRDLEIDIAVDLAGYTDGTRIGILAERPTPVQVSYLGYPGTTGASFIDYLIADRFLVPDNSREFYSEKIVYLPDTYQPNDATRRIADAPPTRADAGLPADGFVFCCFNNSFKITPAIFDVWAQLLRNVDGSVLWLLASNASCVGHLQREAEQRGIAPERLVFAPRVGQEDHLARHRLADLFLDTPNYNAHTTASDALWAGLPVLTCAGTTFAGRVAGSLLTAVGLPELITTSFDDYTQLACRIARHPALAASLRAKLAQNRLTRPLFDTVRFTRHIEAAYRLMWERCRRGEPPADIAVKALNE